MDYKASGIRDRDIDLLWVGKMVDRKMPDIFLKLLNILIIQK